MAVRAIYVQNKEFSGKEMEIYDLIAATWSRPVIAHIIVISPYCRNFPLIF